MLNAVLFMAMSVWAGYFAKTLWFWFVVPFGLPPITWAHGAGIDVFITWLTGSYASVAMMTTDREKPEPSRGVLAAKMKITSAALSIYLFVYGWLLHQLMLRGI